MDNLWKIYDRALEIIEYMDKKYVEVLEEIVLEEAEIVSKKELSDVDKLRLLGLWVMKEIIAEELGLRRKTRREAEAEETYSVVEEVVVNA